MGSQILRFIRIFDVRCEVNRVLLRQRLRSKKQSSHLSQHAISELLTLYIGSILRFTKAEVGVQNRGLLFASACYTQTFGQISEHERHPFSGSTFL